MPAVEQNRRTWDGGYDWSQQGEEWSESWGTSEAQWFGSIYPRIQAFLPAQTILEIAPGYGRWTNYLRRHCQRLIGIDLSEACIRNCRQRFAADSHLTFEVNDGKSLDAVPDGSIDFVFSFDSLVHVEADVIHAYLQQLVHKLKPNGAGFLHHSNIGEYRRSFAIRDRIPKRFHPHLIRRGYFDHCHWRAFSMTAETFAHSCESSGLQCIGQEVVNWGSKRLIDCFSMFTPPGSSFARPNRVTRNADFMREAEQIRRRQALYSLSRQPATHLKVA